MGVCALGPSGREGREEREDLVGDVPLGHAALAVEVELAPQRIKTLVPAVGEGDKACIVACCARPWTRAVGGGRGHGVGAAAVELAQRQVSGARGLGAGGEALLERRGVSRRGGRLRALEVVGAGDCGALVVQQRAG